MTEKELNKACEIVRDLANEYFGDWEQSCKFDDKFRKAMSAVIKDSLTTAGDDAESRFIDKACEAYCLVCKERDTDCYEYCKGLPGKAECNAITDFRKAMAVKDSLTPELTWQDMAKIADIFSHTSRLTRDGMTRSPEDFYSETLKRFKEIKED